MGEWGPVILMFGLIVGGEPGGTVESAGAMTYPSGSLVSHVRNGGSIVDAPVAHLAEADTTHALNDRWFAEDKLKHFFTSLAATNIGYGGVRLIGLEDNAGLIAAGAATTALGLWKEWRDTRQGGPFSYRDLAWDGLGIALGLMVAAQTR